MWIFFDKGTGQEVYRSGIVTKGAKLVLVDYAAALKNALASAPDYTETDLAYHQITDLAEARSIQAIPSLVATIEDGQVVDMQTPPSDPEVWLHLSVTGGDGEDPPGAPTDGTNPLSVSAVLRATDDPASSILTGVNRSYRITVRDDRDATYDVRKITLVDGEMAPVNYSGTGQPAVCEVLESDFEQVKAGDTLYTVRLAERVRFKFFGTLD